MTETAPTAQTGIPRAILSIVDGPGAGRSATADDLGFYSIPDVRMSVTVTVRAPGYLEATRTLSSARDAPNFQLMPVPKTKTATMADSLDTQVGACSDGIAMKPCHILAIPIHNGGPLDATLIWDAAAPADLDLALFQTGSATAMARSASRAGTTERIGVEVPAGATYELRVTYASGTEAAKYTLTVTYRY